MEFKGKKVSDEVEAEMMSRYKYEDYMALDMKDMKIKLQTLGVCVVPDVLSAEECHAVSRGVWGWLREKTSTYAKPMRKNDLSTWSQFFDFTPKHSMLLQNWGVGHAPFVWSVRTNPRVMDVFAHLWNVPPRDLLTSFDGVSLHFPHEVTGRGFYRGNTWLHTDQSYQRTGFECVQSWVTARPVREGDATLAFIPRSHLLHREFASRFGEGTSDDWVKLTAEQQAWYVEQTGSPVHFIKCPRGSMVLWDSRTIHSGSEALRTRPRPNLRQVVYVCMTPRTLCSPKMLEKRIRAFKAGRMTSHWPHRVRVFAEMPRTYGKKVLISFHPQMHEPQKMSGISRRLIGYNQ
jgi:hypothetical protein